MFMTKIKGVYLISRLHKNMLLLLTTVIKHLEINLQDTQVLTYITMHLLLCKL